MRLYCLKAERLSIPFLHSLFLCNGCVVSLLHIDYAVIPTWHTLGLYFGISELRGVKNRPFPLTRHIAYTTACSYLSSCDTLCLTCGRLVLQPPSSSGTCHLSSDQPLVAVLSQLLSRRHGHHVTSSQYEYTYRRELTTWLFKKPFPDIII